MKEDDAFWKRVKALLKAHKMTQKELTGRLGIPLSTFQGWIYYKRIPDTMTAYSMAVTLGVTLNYLLGGRERDITIGRLKELAARDAAGRILDLSIQINKETRNMRPIGRKRPV